MRAVLLASALVLLASGCSDDKAAAPAGASAAQNLKRDCADQKWRDQNLGLWYSLCRQPLRW